MDKPASPTVQDAQSHITFDQRIEAISSYLAYATKIYPRRDEERHRFLGMAGDLADSLLASLDLDGFQPDPKRLEQARALAGNPVFICGQMKSGTTFVTALLDNHPDIFVPPVGSRYLRNADRWERSDLRGIAHYWIPLLINPTGKEPYWFLGPEREPLESFLLHLAWFVRREQCEPFVSGVLAAYCTLEREVAASYWVEKSTQNEREALELKRRFPDAKFIHNIRDPLTNLASLKRLSGVRGRKFRARKRAQTLRHLFQAGEKNRQALGEDTYRIVRYEDLVSRTAEVMRELAGFLGIDFRDSLLTPTENGRPALSNSMYAESRVQGRVLDQSKSTRFLDDLTPEECRQIVHELGDTVGRFGYDWSSLPIPSRRWWFF